MAGSAVTVSRKVREFSKNSSSKRVEIVVISWTADDADGTVPETEVELYGYCLKAVTDPGATSPTDNYDITLVDPDVSGLDALGGGLLNRDTANTEVVVPAVAGNPGTVSSFPLLLAGTYTFTLENNSVNSATGTVYLYLVDNLF